jgi:AcrR family transcriptional regulator
MSGMKDLRFASDSTEPRERILAAAAARIIHYGYSKTTMSEIATDCDMSAGNIYRFFPSKLDIAEEMARRFNTESHLVFDAIVSDRGRSPTRKLFDFFDTRLSRLFTLFEQNPKLLEMAEFLRRERPAFLVEEDRQERKYIESILIEGVESGDLALPHPPHIVADLVGNAMLRFGVPAAWATERLEGLRRQQHALIELLISGLAARR